MKKLYTLTAVLAAALLFCSCSKDDDPGNSLVGKWKSETFTQYVLLDDMSTWNPLGPQDTEGYYVFEFRADGSCYELYGANGAPQDMRDYEGSYSFDTATGALTITYPDKSNWKSTVEFTDANRIVLTQRVNTYNKASIVFNKQ